MLMSLYHIKRNHQGIATSIFFLHIAIIHNNLANLMVNIHSGMICHVSGTMFIKNQIHLPKRIVVQSDLSSSNSFICTMTFDVVR